MLKRNAQTIKTLILLAFLAFFGFLVSQTGPQTVEAQTTTSPVTGWGWGGEGSPQGGLGWINFNCVTLNQCADQGGVDWGISANVDENSSTYGRMSGYAWSSTFGWLSFEPSDVSQCYVHGGAPTPPTMTDLALNPSTVKVTGWARFLVGDDTHDWDGCVSFSDDTGNGYYEVEVNPGSGVFDGYAWAGNRSLSQLGLGWIALGSTGGCAGCGVTVTLPGSGTNAISFTASDYSLPVGGGQTTLMWDATNADPGNPVGSCQTSSSPSHPLWFIGASGPLGIGIPNGNLPQGNRVVSLTETTVFNLSCTDLSGNALPTQTLTVTVGGFGANAISFTASDYSLPVGGGQTTLMWDATNADPGNPVGSCQTSSSPSHPLWFIGASGPLGIGIPNGNLPQGNRVVSLTETTVFNLSCTDLSGNALPTQTLTVTVGGVVPEPAQISLQASPTTISYSDFSNGSTSTNLVWQVQQGGVNGCVATSSPGTLADWTGSFANPPASKTVDLVSGGIDVTHTFTIVCFDNQDNSQVIATASVTVQDDPCCGGGGNLPELALNGTQNVTTGGPYDNVFLEWTSQYNFASCTGIDFQHNGTSLPLAGWIGGSLGTPTDNITLDLGAYGPNFQVGEQLFFEIECTQSDGDTATADHIINIVQPNLPPPVIVDFHITDPTGPDGSFLVETLGPDGQNIELSWNVQDATTCTASSNYGALFSGSNPDWDGTISLDPVSGTQIVDMKEPFFNENTMYTLTCENDNGDTDSASVHVYIDGVACVPPDDPLCNPSGGVIPIYIET